MTWAQVIVYAAGTATLVAAGAGVSKVGLALWRGIQRLVRLMDDLQGEPARPGFDARPGVMERLGTIEERVVAVPSLEQAIRALTVRVGAIEAELHPNGGSSFRDRVDRALPPERPKVEAGGIIQVERAYEHDTEGVRLAYGFIDQHR